MRNSYSHSASPSFGTTLALSILCHVLVIVAAVIGIRHADAGGKDREIRHEAPPPPPREQPALRIPKFLLIAAPPLKGPLGKVATRSAAE